MMQEVIIVNSEEDAFALLDRLSSGELDFNLENIDFGDWSRLTIRLTGDKFHSSITPTVMRGLLEVQKGIYRSYAIMKYGSESTVHLSDEERKKLEILVTVSEGSALIEALFAPIGEAVSKGVLSHMSPDAQLGLILLLLVGFGGYKVIAHLLSSRKDVKIAEIEASNKTEIEKAQLKANLDMLQLNNDAHTENLKILAKVIEKFPAAEKVVEVVKDSQEALVKAVVAAEPDKIEIQHIDLPIAAAETLVSGTRHQWLEVRLDDKFKILAIDSSNTSSLKVRILGADGIETLATLQDETMDRRHLEAISDALLDRAKIDLTINAKKREDLIKDVVIIGAKPIK